MGNKMLRETWCIVISYNTVSTDLWDKMKKTNQINGWRKTKECPEYL